MQEWIKYEGANGMIYYFRSHDKFYNDLEQANLKDFEFKQVYEYVVWNALRTLKCVQLHPFQN